MAKTAMQRLQAKKDPKKVILDKDFAGIKAGQRMLVGTPKMIDQYIQKIPAGEERSVSRLRNELARRNKCDATCPVSTAIFIRIVAEAALEKLAEGAEVSELTPFWRVIDSGHKIAKRLDIDPEWIDTQRALEQPA